VADRLGASGDGHTWLHNTLMKTCLCEKDYKSVWCEGSRGGRRIVGQANTGQAKVRDQSQAGTGRQAGSGSGQAERSESGRYRTAGRMVRTGRN
jgi:hypothetical protein